MTLSSNTPSQLLRRKSPAQFRGKIWWKINSGENSVNSFLFSLNTEVDELALQEKIIETVEIYEPRASVRNVEVISNDNRNEVAVTVTFQVLSTNEILTTEISLTRLR